MTPNEAGVIVVGGNAQGSRKRIAPHRAISHNPWPFAVIQVISDLTALGLAWYSAIGIRLLLNPYMSLQLTREELIRLSPSLVAVLATWIVVSCWLERSDRHSGFWVSRFVKIVESAVAVSATIIVCTFFSATLGAPVSRSIVLLLATVSGVFPAIACACWWREPAPRKQSGKRLRLA